MLVHPAKLEQMITADQAHVVADGVILAVPFSARFGPEREAMTMKKRGRPSGLPRPSQARRKKLEPNTHAELELPGSIALGVEHAPSVRSVDVEGRIGKLHVVQNVQDVELELRAEAFRNS